jgi:hypothetical protein
MRRAGVQAAGTRRGDLGPGPGGRRFRGGRMALDRSWCRRTRRVRCCRRSDRCEGPPRRGASTLDAHRIRGPVGRASVRHPKSCRAPRPPASRRCTGSAASAAPVPSAGAPRSARSLVPAAHCSSALSGSRCHPVPEVGAAQPRRRPGGAAAVPGEAPPDFSGIGAVARPVPPERGERRRRGPPRCVTCSRRALSRTPPVTASPRGPAGLADITAGTPPRRRHRPYRWSKCCHAGYGSSPRSTRSHAVRSSVRTSGRTAALSACSRMSSDSRWRRSLPSLPR